MTDDEQTPAKPKPLLITIDGHAKSGRSVIAQGLRAQYKQKENIDLHIYDVGLLYRAVAAAVLDNARNEGRTCFEITPEEIMSEIDKFYYEAGIREEGNERPPISYNAPDTPILSPKHNLWNTENSFEASQKGSGDKDRFKERFYNEDVEHVTAMMSEDLTIKKAMRDFGRGLIDHVNESEKDGVIVVGRTAGIRFYREADAIIMAKNQSQALQAMQEDTRSGRHRRTLPPKSHDRSKSIAELKRKGYVVVDTRSKTAETSINKAYAEVKAQLETPHHRLEQHDAHIKEWAAQVKSGRDDEASRSL